MVSMIQKPDARERDADLSREDAVVEQGTRDHPHIRVRQGFVKIWFWATLCENLISMLVFLTQAPPQKSKPLKLLTSEG